MKEHKEVNIEAKYTIPDPPNTQCASCVYALQGCEAFRLKGTIVELSGTGLEGVVEQQLSKRLAEVHLYTHSKPIVPAIHKRKAVTVYCKPAWSVKLERT